jgi:hypothetical protein
VSEIMGAWRKRIRWGCSAHLVAGPQVGISWQHMPHAIDHLFIEVSPLLNTFRVYACTQLGIITKKKKRTKQSTVCKVPCSLK